MHVSLNIVLKFMVIYTNATRTVSPACQVQLSVVCLKGSDQNKKMRL